MYTVKVVDSPNMRLHIAFLAILMFWNEPRMWTLLQTIHKLRRETKLNVPPFYSTLGTIQSIYICLTLTKGNRSGLGGVLFSIGPKGGQTFLSIRLHPLSQHHTLASTLASVKSLGNGLF